MDELSVNLEVRGLETVEGGTFKDVIIAGMGKVKGKILARVIEVNGNGQISGEINAENLMIAGSFVADKDVELKNTLNLKGTGNFAKNITCEDILASGNFASKGDIKFREADINGVFSARGILTGDKFEVLGSLDMSSDLRVNKVKINFSEKSNCNDILADDVSIETIEGKKGLFSKFKKTIFKCNEIRAKKVFIENTECKLIVADEIIIGENCKVDKVDYVDSFEFAKSSEVKETVCRK